MQTNLPARAALLGALALAIAEPALAGRTFYVDFNAGSDANPGTTPDRPWKHAPGSPEKPVTLSAGDRVLFRGGVRYRGGLRPKATGTADQPVVFDGSAWGATPAIFDGSTPISGARRCASAAECFNNPNWPNLWRLPIPATTLWTDWLFAGDRALQPAQYPDMPLMAADNIDNYLVIPKAQTTQLKAGTISFALPASLSAGTPVLGLWTQGNQVSFTDQIRVSANGVTIGSGGWINGGFNPYTDRDNRFTLINLPAMVKRPGTFAMSPKDGIAIAWPWTAFDTSFSSSARRPGFNLSRASFAEIRGFTFANYAASPGNSYSGIAVLSAAGSKNNSIVGNIIRAGINLATGRAVALIAGSNISFRNNILTMLPFTSAVQVDNSAGPMLFQCNMIYDIGRTAIRLNNTANMTLKGNFITRITNIHGNGISLYNDTRNAVVTDNVVTASDRPITLKGATTDYFASGTKSILLARNIFMSTNPDSAGIISYGNVANATITDNYASGPVNAISLRGTETGLVATGNTLVGGFIVYNKAPIFDASANVFQSPDGNGIAMNGSVGGLGLPAMCYGS
jgi:hypothetical protein